MFRGLVAKLPLKDGLVVVGVAVMRDMVADWRKWSRGERVLAVIITVLMVALPLGLLLSGKIGA